MSEPIVTFRAISRQRTRAIEPYHRDDGKISISTVAEMSGVSESPVRRACETGLLPHSILKVKVLVQLRIDPLDWLRWDARERALIAVGEMGGVDGCGRKRLQKWIECGLPCERRGLRRLVHVPTVRAWIAEHRPNWNQKRQRYAPTICSPDHRAGIIYGIFDPRCNTSELRYIGKTGDRKGRWRDHELTLQNGTHHNPRLQRWFNKLSREGVSPEFKELQSCLPFTMDECEREWIARGKAKGWRLCNVTDGGCGGAWADESRAKAKSTASANWKKPEYQVAHELSRAKRKGMTVELYRIWCTQQAEIRGRNRAVWRSNMALAADRAEKRAIGKVAWRASRIVPLMHSGVAFLPLTNGKRALVDASDWPHVSQHVWSATLKAGRYWRAKTNIDQQLVLLNRFVMNAADGEMIVYRNGNQLDCRRCNLIVLAQRGGRPRVAA